MREVSRFAIVLGLSVSLGLGAGCAASRAPADRPGTPPESMPDLAMGNPLPSGERSDMRADEETVVADTRIFMDKEGRITLGGREMAAERLGSALEQAGIPRDAVVHVQAHPQAPFEQAVRTVRLVREAGYARVALETDLPK